MSLQGGLYFLQLFDHYVCSGNNLLLLSVCQSIGVGWIYGELIEFFCTKRNIPCCVAKNYTKESIGVNDWSKAPAVALTWNLIGYCPVRPDYCWTLANKHFNVTDVYVGICTSLNGLEKQKCKRNENKMYVSSDNQEEIVCMTTLKRWSVIVLRLL